MDYVWGVDMGGTNVRVAKVDPTADDALSLVGEVVTKEMKDINSNEELADFVEGIIGKKKASVGICSAGDVDEENLVVRLSPNSPNFERIELGDLLRKAGHDVVLTNDMRAAVSAEAINQDKKHGRKDVLVATYSSGYNCAVARERTLVTTAEFGHQKYNAEFSDDDPYAPVCGCGNVNCLEIFVSGNGAVKLAKIRLKKMAEEGTDIRTTVTLQEVFAETVTAGIEEALDKMTAKHIYRAFTKDPLGEPQHYVARVQRRAIAHSFGAMLSAYNPLDVMVLMGSQTKDWKNLFEPAMQRFNEGGFNLPSLKKPEIVKTELPEIGIQGAVAYYLSAERKIPYRQ